MEKQVNSFTNSLYPLSLIRSVRGIPSLVFEELQPNDIPEPYFSLLVHEGDMTSRLESYFDDKICVKKLSSSNDGKSYFREVILETINSSTITEYGAIEIKLENLNEELKPIVIEARKPLGAILNEAQIPYVSSPRAFLKVIPDNEMIDVFGTVESDYLFGRSNEISSYTGQTIARIVEVLPSL
tara:strand:- start:8736 stop:9287 length:552 start_codon:yes stop_codon:yes gene_type:complete